MLLPLFLALAPLGAAALYDDFTTYNASVWSYADGSMGTTDKCKVSPRPHHAFGNEMQDCHDSVRVSPPPPFCPPSAPHPVQVWYLKNHSKVDADLSLSEGKGLRMLMSSTPCRQNPESCKGAKMAADHVSSIATHHFGDYELRMRAPYAVNGGSTSAACDAHIVAAGRAGSRRQAEGGRGEEEEEAVRQWGEGVACRLLPCPVLLPMCSSSASLAARPLCASPSPPPAAVCRCCCARLLPCPCAAPAAVLLCLLPLCARCLLPCLRAPPVLLPCLPAAVPVCLCCCPV